MITQSIRRLLITELQYFWSVGQINTRFEVMSYCVGRLEKIDEHVVDAINALYCEKYIQE